MVTVRAISTWLACWSRVPLF